MKIKTLIKLVEIELLETKAKLAKIIEQKNKLRKYKLDKVNERHLELQFTKNDPIYQLYLKDALIQFKTIIDNIDSQLLKLDHDESLIVQLLNDNFRRLKEMQIVQETLHKRSLIQNQQIENKLIDEIALLRDSKTST